jgi:hypothetical protein
VRLEGLGELKISNDLVGNQTRELPACSTVPEPTTLPRAPSQNSPAEATGASLATADEMKQEEQNNDA